MERSQDDRAVEVWGQTLTHAVQESLDFGQEQWEATEEF